jgi:hypothetical protein
MWAFACSNCVCTPCASPRVAKNTRPPPRAGFNYGNVDERYPNVKTFQALYCGLWKCVVAIEMNFTQPSYLRGHQSRVHRGSMRIQASKTSQRRPV